MIYNQLAHSPSPPTHSLIFLSSLSFCPTNRPSTDRIMQRQKYDLQPTRPQPIATNTLPHFSVAPIFLSNQTDHPPTETCSDRNMIFNQLTHSPRHQHTPSFFCRPYLSVQPTRPSTDRNMQRQKYDLQPAHPQPIAHPTSSSPNTLPHFCRIFLSNQTDHPSLNSQPHFFRPS